MVDEREEEAKEHLGEAQDDGHLHFDRVHELQLVQRVRPDGVEPEPVGVLELVRPVRVETDLLELDAVDRRIYRLFTARKRTTLTSAMTSLLHMTSPRYLCSKRYLYNVQVINRSNRTYEIERQLQPGGNILSDLENTSL